MPTKEEIINQIAAIDEQLEQNKAFIEQYSGLEVETDSAIWRLVSLTQSLLFARQYLAMKLIEIYGVFVM